MASGKKGVTIPNNIPDDLLITNIFLRLPAKQIAQMRSLSKPWNTILSSPSFIKSHLDHSTHNNDEILMVFESVHCFKNIKAFTPNPTRPPQPTDFVKHLVVKPLCDDGGCNIIGSVNGLICLHYDYYYYKSIFIWNPSLSAILRLPPYSMPSTQGYHIYFRFGFDPKTDDYKVVKLTANIQFGFRDEGNKDKDWKQVEVYSMRKHSWEFIKSFPSPCTDIIDHNEVCVDGRNGHLHWLAYDEKKGVDLIRRQKIIAYDLGAETFGPVSLPDSIQVYKDYRSNVLDFMTGKLCVMSKVKDCDQYELWVMDQYGLAESWVKLHVFSHLDGIHRPLGFTLNNELVYIDNDGFIALYDPNSSKVNSFNIKVSMNCRNKIVQYVDSLVWVVAAKHCIRKKPHRPKKGFRTWFTGKGIGHLRNTS